jgi:hypothetical protein
VRLAKQQRDRLGAGGLKLSSLIQKIGGGAGRARGKQGEAAAAPVMTDAVRFPYGPFRFKTALSKGAKYTVLASTDLKTWATISQGKAAEETVENVDSEAFKFSYRFYRLQMEGVFSANVIGYAAVSLPPGFSMIANPFETEQTVAETFRDWPDKTSLSRFDTRLFRLTENEVKDGKWANPLEKLAPGEGAIFFNPTSDYKSGSFVGEVLLGHLSAPIPSGFSVRSSLVPQPGNLEEDLKFPITNGDVIHIFDRDRQKYVLHPYEEGKWTAGAPVVSVGESFWVAKTEPGNWTRNFVIEG